MQLLNQLFTVLVLGGSATPDVTIIPVTIETPAECARIAEDYRKGEPVLIDRVSGRPVVATFHKCVALNGERELRNWQDALDQL